LLIALSIAAPILLIAAGGGATFWYVGHRQGSVAPPATIFAGTPVGAWASGEDGIVEPTPTATANFSRATVDSDLAVVKQALITSRLDPNTLVRHDTSAFVNLLAPNARSDVQDRVQHGAFIAWYITKVDGGDALTGDPIKVAGTMTYTQTTDSRGLRELVITTNYVFVYPFAGVGTKPGDHLVVLHQRQNWIFPDDAGVSSDTLGLWIGAGATNVYNVDCRNYFDGLLVLDTYVPDMTGAFDPNTPVDGSHGNCPTPS
jgi:hypothetical protein